MSSALTRPVAAQQRVRRQPLQLGRERQRAIGELYLRDLKQPALALPYLRRACELDSTDYTARALEKKAQTALEKQVRNPAAHRVP